MKVLRKFFEFPNFYSLSLIFAVIGSCLIFIPPLVPTERFLHLINSVFPFPRPLLVETLFNALASLGIEFYGSSILSFAFGVVDEKEGQEKEIQQVEFQKNLFAKIEALDKKVSELSAVIETKNADYVSKRAVRKNHWLWYFLFG